jgi:hypothetical protein
LAFHRRAREWVEAGTFDSLGDAARRVAELEGTPEKHGVFFEVFVEADQADDANLAVSTSLGGAAFMASAAASTEYFNENRPPNRDRLSWARLIRRTGRRR